MCSKFNEFSFIIKDKILNLVIHNVTITCVMWIQSQIRWRIDWNQDIRFSHSSHCIPARSLVHIKMQSCTIYEFYLGQRNVLLLHICFSIYIALTDVYVACSSSYTFGDEIMSWVFHVSPFPCPGQQLSHETIQSINQSGSPSPYHMTFQNTI